ncbi:Endonuclease/exonuclease/phosphatase [Cladorrhinum sp. PSN259]|nr:Endonuclease/exonuclease/phosphatase [Cladorrhinum sp. PSN259]
MPNANLQAQDLTSARQTVLTSTTSTGTPTLGLRRIRAPPTIGHDKKTELGYVKVEVDGLKVLQMNLKQSAERLRKLANDILDNDRHVNVIAIQDPPESLFRSSGLWRSYNLDYNSSTKATDIGAPVVPPVAFLVYKMIPPTSFRSLSYQGLGSFEPYVRTLMIDSDIGPLSITNVYNHTNRMDQNMIKSLACHSTGNRHLLVGDFNLHHTVWGGPDDSDSAMGQKLVDEMASRRMICLNKPGLATFERGVQETVIDLTFAGPDMASFVQQWDVLEVEAWKGDHKPILTQIGRVVRRETPVFCN